MNVETMRLERNRQMTHLLFALSLSLLLCACGKEKAQDQKERVPADNPGRVTLTEEGIKLAGIKTEKVAIRSIPVEFSAAGEIGFNEKKLVHLTPRVSGWVDKVYAFVGDRVEAGDSLASLYSPEFLSAQSEFIQAEERLKNVAPADAAEHRTAEALFNSARSRLLLFGAGEGEISRLAASHQPAPHLVIKSPMSGTVVASNLIPGNTVDKGANLFQISDLSSLWVTASVYEKDIQGVQKGEQVKVRVTSVGGRTFAGTVQSINDVLDENTRTFKVRIAIENLIGELKPEMFCECFFAGRSGRPILAVPVGAIQQLGTEQIVFVTSGQNSFEKREVKTGEEVGDYVEILGGVKAGEEVVMAGAFTLKSELFKSGLKEE